jgi:hypothetical protein
VTTTKPCLFCGVVDPTPHLLDCPIAVVLVKRIEQADRERFDRYRAALVVDEQLGALEDATPWRDLNIALQLDDISTTELHETIADLRRQDRS